MMLNAFIFIARVIILLLVCLIIVDLFHVNASAMIEFIEEILPNFLTFFSSVIVCGV
jgi:hypothetical protein